MPRWKQVFRCTQCRRRRWREVEDENFLAPEPDVEQLKRAARCGECGCREIDVRQYKLMWRSADQTFPGGMRMGLIDFSRCQERDREIAEALRSEKTRRIDGPDWQHPTDPEFGWEGNADGSAPFGLKGVSALDRKG